MQQKKSSFFDTKVLGHPLGLFILFFTEMWERFSFYGMRILLIQFLIAEVILGSPKSGWGWSPEQATALYGTYVMLLYLTPIIGGMVARHIGTRKTIILGAIILTLGQACMAFEIPVMFYLGLTGLVLGTGFFKPNMPSILGEMYKSFPEKKDGAYTIFYMGVNCGAFFGTMLCGYLAETEGWYLGFGLAALFMALGTLQFVFAQPMMGNLGLLEDKKNLEEKDTDTDKRNPFTIIDYILIGIVSVLGLLYAFNDPLSKQNIIDLFSWANTSNMWGQNLIIIITLVLFIYLLVSRILRYDKIVRNRMFGVVALAIFLIFFFMSFEQGASSLILVAREYVDRRLDGNSLLTFNIVNAALTLIPLIIISYVLIKLALKTWKQIALSNIMLFLCFSLIWGVVIWMLYTEFTKEASEITVSWFSILNSFFVITLASVVSKIWDSKYNPSAAFKYGFGLLLVSFGFLIMWLGATTGEEGKISMIFLVMTYLFLTLGELFISPVGLSYVSKLVPHRMLALMYGIWYLAIAIAQKVAATLGGQVEKIAENYSLGHFFLLFTIIPATAGLLVMLLNPLIKKLMQGVK
jgi:amino acid/peptide transporter